MCGNEPLIPPAQGISEVVEEGVVEEDGEMQVIQGDLTSMI